MGMPRSLASRLRLTAQPSLLLSTTTGTPFQLRAEQTFAAHEEVIAINQRISRSP
ncbi:MAG: hypothetical protein WDN27_06200 [Candidatus Saccharibacteria bacterium]